MSDERSMTTQSTRIAELEALVAAFSSELKSSRAQIASVADHTRAPGTWRAGGAWG